MWQTAIRETEEETGVRTEFVAMLTFRHMHEYRWGTSDIYFSCLLRPLSTDITINPAEIADATWMDVRESTLCILLSTFDCYDSTISHHHSLNRKNLLGD